MIAAPQPGNFDQPRGSYAETMSHVWTAWSRWPSPTSTVDHVWIEIDGRDWGTATANFAHGPGYGDQSTEGFLESHPPGL